MALLIVLIALLIERFFDWSHLRQLGWYTTWQRFFTQRTAALSPYVGMVLGIIPLLLAVVAIEYALKDVLYGLVGFVFQLALFLYCLGPQNLWADALACVQAFHQDDVSIVFNRLGITMGVSSPSSKEALVTPIFIAAHRRVFACVFWFVALGPVGVVLYRLVTSSAASMSEDAVSARAVNASRTLESLLDFLPARVLACLFALAGHFVSVLRCWKSDAMFQLNTSDVLLAQAGQAALGVDEVNQLSDEAVVKSALALLDRVFIISVVILAVAVLIG